MAKVTRPYKDAPAEAATSITARLTPDGKCGEDTRFSRADRVMGKALYVRVQVDGSRKWVKVGTISRLPCGARRNMILMFASMNGSMSPG